MVDKVNEIEDSANKAKKIEYRDCYVAFLDILGFKELIKTSECSDIFNLSLTFLSRDTVRYNE